MNTFTSSKAQTSMNPLTVGDGCKKTCREIEKKQHVDHLSGSCLAKGYNSNDNITIGDSVSVSIALTVTRI